MTRARDVGNKGWQSSPILVYEKDITGTDFNPDYDPIEIEPGYDYEMKLLSFERVNDATSGSLTVQIGVDGTVDAGANYGYNYFRRTSAGDLNGQELVGQNFWYLHQAAWGVGYTGNFLYSFRQGVSKASFVGHNASYATAVGHMTGVASGYYTGTGTDVTHIRIYSSTANQTYVGGIIQLYKLPRMGD